MHLLWLQYCHLDSIIHLNAGSFNLFTKAELDSGCRLCVVPERLGLLVAAKTTTVLMGRLNSG